MKKLRKRWWLILVPVVNIWYFIYCLFSTIMYTQEVD